MSRRPLALFCAIILLGLIGVVAVRATRLFHRASLQAMSYNGVSIGATVNEVKYMLGDPETVSNARMETPEPNKSPQYRVADLDQSSPSWLAKLPPIPGGKRMESFVHWSMSGDNVRIVYFDKPSGQVIGLECDQWPWATKDPCSPFDGIHPGLKEDQVNDSIGAPDKSVYVGGSKTLYYYDLRIEINLIRGDVFSIKKTKPTILGIARIALKDGLGLSI